MFRRQELKQFGMKGMTEHDMLRIWPRRRGRQQADLVMVRISEWVSEVVLGCIVGERVCGQVNNVNVLSAVSCMQQGQK